MRSITLEAYKIIYLITGAKKFSYYFALAFITLLNFIFLKGACTLMQPIFSPLQYILMIFRFPFNVGTYIALFVINMLIVPFKMTDFVNSVKTMYVKLLIFIFMAILLYGYGKFIDRYF